MCSSSTVLCFLLPLTIGHSRKRHVCVLHPLSSVPYTIGGKQAPNQVAADSTQVQPLTGEKDDHNLQLRKCRRDISVEDSSIKERGRVVKERMKENSVVNSKSNVEAKGVFLPSNQGGGSPGRQSSVTVPGIRLMSKNCTEQSHHQVVVTPNIDPPSSCQQLKKQRVIKTPSTISRSNTRYAAPLSTTPHISTLSCDAQIATVISDRHQQTLVPKVERGKTLESMQEKEVTEESIPSLQLQNDGQNQRVLSERQPVSKEPSIPPEKIHTPRHILPPPHITPHEILLPPPTTSHHIPPPPPTTAHHIPPPPPTLPPPPTTSHHIPPPPPTLPLPPTTSYHIPPPPPTTAHHIPPPPPTLSPPPTTSHHIPPPPPTHPLHTPCTNYCLGCRPRLKCPLITSRTFLNVLHIDKFTCPYHQRLGSRLVQRKTTTQHHTLGGAPTIYEQITPEANDSTGGGDFDIIPCQSTTPLHVSSNATDSFHPQEIGEMNSSLSSKPSTSTTIQSSMCFSSPPTVSGTSDETYTPLSEPSSDSMELGTPPLTYTHQPAVARDSGSQVEVVTAESSVPDSSSSVSGTRQQVRDVGQKEWSTSAVLPPPRVCPPTTVGPPPSSPTQPPLSVRQHSMLAAVLKLQYLNPTEALPPASSTTGQLHQPRIQCHSNHPLPKKLPSTTQLSSSRNSNDKSKPIITSTNVTEKQTSNDQLPTSALISRPGRCKKQYQLTHGPQKRRHPVQSTSHSQRGPLRERGNSVPGSEYDYHTPIKSKPVQFE